MNQEDETIDPRESEHFGFYAKDGTTVVPYDQWDLYKND